MSVQAVEQGIEREDVAIGSYSLETLTTGMYENPFHCIREYVQNGYDAIRAARARGTLSPNSGQVTIAISGSGNRQTLSVRDNGCGISVAEAVTTLVSIGASRKRSSIDAGFRGIGRLAGIAYCGTLRFTTSVAGEDLATVASFDCGSMRGFMRPGADVQDVREVMRLCVKTWSIEAKPEEHFTEVEMIGLTGLGHEFAEIKLLTPYLRQVCPTDYTDRFTYAGRIRQLAEGFGAPIESIEVEIRYKRERTQILKAYEDSSPTSDAKKPSIIRDIEPILAPDLGWFGWIGLSNFNGEITDHITAGVRFRLKNIQVGGSEIIEDLAAGLTGGGTEGRLMRWAVGEVFVTNPAVVPNARRDGFEDSAAWREIRQDIRQRIAKRVVFLVRAASNSRGALKKITGEVADVEHSISQIIGPGAPAEALTAKIEKVIAKLRPDKLSGGEPNAVGELTAKLKDLKDKLVEQVAQSDNEAGSARPGGDPRPVTPGGDAPGAGAETEGGRGEAESRSNEQAGRPWSAEELLSALKAVLLRELGDEEAGRMFALARELLEEVE